jgi:hypothetical protein
MNATEPSRADGPLATRSGKPCGAFRRFTPREGYPVSLAAG